MQRTIRIWIIFLALNLAASCAFAQYLRIGDICRVKGQEENTLHGIGLVAGLNGTGDGNVGTTRALARMLELLGNPVAVDANRQPLLEELKDTKNIAMVFVTATVPAKGARQGDRLNCSVSAMRAKSLEGGRLLVTALQGPQPGNPRVYAFAEGPIKLDATAPPTSGSIHTGCRLEENFDNPFIKDGQITLVLDNNHASFQTAYDIEARLNDPRAFGGVLDGNAEQEQQAGVIARAIDQVNIVVRIREEYANNPVEFVSQILDVQILPPQHDARVVINERNGVIVIGDNVLVGRVAVTHGNVTIETGDGTGDGPLFVLDQLQDTSVTRLNALVNALNALQVGTGEIIEIIKGLERSGDLYGKLIIE